MSRFLAIAITGSLLYGSFATAQTVATNPVGFNTVTVSPNSVRALSLPFNKPADFQGNVSAVTSTTIQTAGNPWVANAFGPFGTNPHLVRMLSGAQAGRQYRIASNTGNTLTLLAGSDTTGVAANDQFQVFPSETLATVFGGTPPAGVNANADNAQADNVLLRVGNSWITYYYDPTGGVNSWVRQGPGTPSNNVAITPEQGFLFVRRAGSYDFTALGAVPISNLRTDLPASSTTSIGNRFPVDMTLVTTGNPSNTPSGDPKLAFNFDTLAGWNKNADSTVADNVLLRVGNSWITYYYDPSQGGPTNGNPGSWVRQGPGTVNQNPAIPAGTSILVVHRAGSTLVLNQSLPYTLP